MIEVNKPPNKPTPIRLKNLKAPLQQEAMRLDRSLHWLVCNILTDYVKNLKPKK